MTEVFDWQENVLTHSTIPKFTTMICHCTFCFLFCWLKVLNSLGSIFTCYHRKGYRPESRLSSSYSTHVPKLQSRQRRIFYVSAVVTYSTWNLRIIIPLTSTGAGGVEIFLKISSRFGTRGSLALNLTIGKKMLQQTRPSVLSLLGSHFTFTYVKSEIESWELHISFLHN